MTGAGAQSAYLAGAAVAGGINPDRVVLMAEPCEPLLPGSARPLTEQMLHAHYAGNTEEIQRLCLRAEAGLAPTGIRDLTDQQLESRLWRIHVLLAAVNDEAQRRDRDRSARHSAERAAWLKTEQAKSRPLDPSE
ncbi:MAG TPA: hypothetical protein VD932_05485 [Aquabacterium sp.]|nr:hypothetical protein [Aquabacterium sp.]